VQRKLLTLQLQPSIYLIKCNVVVSPMQNCVVAILVFEFLLLRSVERIASAGERLEYLSFCAQLLGTLIPNLVLRLLQSMILS
jgi:hypothetical protein